MPALPSKNYRPSSTAPFLPGLLIPWDSDILLLAFSIFSLGSGLMMVAAELRIELFKSNFYADQCLRLRIPAKGSSDIPMFRE